MSDDVTVCEACGCLVSPTGPEPCPWCALVLGLLRGTDRWIRTERQQQPPAASADDRAR